jgi:hypothetical protein
MMIGIASPIETSVRNIPIAVKNRNGFSDR